MHFITTFKMTIIVTAYSRGDITEKLHAGEGWLDDLKSKDPKTSSA
jgi:hypothetical protein